MKKILKLTALFAAAAVAFALSSCSKDDMNEKRIVGKWQSESVSYKYYKEGELFESGSMDSINWYINYVFKADGSGQLFMYLNGKAVSAQVTWVIIGNKLMVSSDDGAVMTHEIESIKGNQMVLSLVDEYTEGGLKCKDITTYTFKKI